MFETKSQSQKQENKKKDGKKLATANRIKQSINQQLISLHDGGLSHD